MSVHAVKLPTCPNCATDLSQGENFCPTCGQPNHDVNVTFSHVLEETLEGLFHFDSKVWITFRDLLLKPGKLTVDFLAGRRARFVPPIRLYVFVSLVFFFLLGREASHGDANRGPIIEFGPNNPPAAFTRTDSLVASPRGGGGGFIFERDSAQSAQARKRGTRVSFDGVGDLTSTDLANPALLARVSEGEPALLDSLIRARGGQPGFWKRLSYRQTARLSAKQEALGHQLVQNLSVGMFLLMPLFALLLKLFYRRSRPLYVQHLIFSVHLHSFFFVLFSFLLLVTMALPKTRYVPTSLPLLAMMLYWLLALRRFSGQSLRRTLWKGPLLAAGYLGMLLFFTFSVLMISLLLF